MSVRCSLWTVDNEQVTVPIHLAYCSLVAALRRYARVRSPNLAIVVVKTPDAINSFVAAGRLYLEQILGRKESGNPFVRAIRRTKTDRLTEAEVYRDADADRSILVCASLDDIDDELRLFADIVEFIREPTPTQITATFRKYGHVLSKDDEQMIAAETWTRLVYAFQRGRSVKVGLRRLRETSNSTKSSKLTYVVDGPTLADLSGLGPAKEWGLQLARELNEFDGGKLQWDEVDTGALIYGPPGTGKTLFAQALARTCRVPIVVASAARWQASGYLNDLLKAMQESFREAQSKAPSVLFIDELDAIGSRSINDSHNSDYKRQVINGLLELLDGFERRTGVVVIGATNHPENLDPALLRSGRLGRHLEIPLPDATARREILHSQAGFPVPEEHSDVFAHATTGMSGADLEQMVRDGRRFARLQGKQFEFQHIIEVAPRLVDLSTEQMRVAAFHEAGHAIVGVELGLELRGISINDKVIANGKDTLGGAEFAMPRFPIKTRSYFLNHISMYLAGIAAETLVFGEFTDGAAGGQRSDLGLATTLATKVEACYGMGETFAIDLAEERHFAQLRLVDLRLRKAVTNILDVEFRRAKTILHNRLDALNAVADRLIATRKMEAIEVHETLMRFPVG